MKLRCELELAEHAARTAGDLLRNLSAEPVSALSQIGKDIKLVADRDSEHLLYEILSQNSSYGFLGEEGGMRAGDWPLWIVDPLDGSLNFSRGIPFSCVSIALWEKDKPLLGVIFDFNNGDFYSGIPGEGAWCNGLPMRVSNVVKPGKAVLATGFPVNRNYETESLQRFLLGIQRFKKIRMLGTAAMSLAYVASGRVDAYEEESIMFWDVAAGIALVEAAGGYVNFNEKPQAVNWKMNVRCGSSSELF